MFFSIGKDNTMDPVKELEQLRAERQSYISKTFILVLEMLAIFAVPATFAYFAGVIWGPLWWKILLPVAFIISWIIVIRIYIRINKKLSDIDRRVEELQGKMKVQ